MSTKKDNFQLSDKKLMKLAISLAENQKYFTGTNPSVGCVITRNNKIISYSVTGKNGRPHAEINAINKNKSKDLYNSSMYVSLEPCTHSQATFPFYNANANTGKFCIFNWFLQRDCIADHESFEK